MKSATLYSAAPSLHAGQGLHAGVAGLVLDDLGHCAAGEFHVARRRLHDLVGEGHRLRIHACPSRTLDDSTRVIKIH